MFKKLKKSQAWLLLTVVVKRLLQDAEINLNDK